MVLLYLQIYYIIFRVLSQYYLPVSPVYGIYLLTEPEKYAKINRIFISTEETT